MVFQDLSRPYTVSGLSPYRELRLHIPRDAFAERNGSVELLSGSKVPAGDPLGTLFTGYLEGYAAALPTMTEVQAEVGLDGVLHLLSSLVAGVTGVERAGVAALSETGLLALAERLIAARLGDARLDAAGLARALGVSRTRLYHAFAARGGVARAIRDARMDRAGHLLGTQAHAGRSIEAISALCGFGDYGTFARGFRRRFGASPRDWRGR